LSSEKNSARPAAAFAATLQTNPIVADALPPSEKPSGLTRCRVDLVARQSRPTLPVFGGISGSTKTTLNTKNLIWKPGNQEIVFNNACSSLGFPGFLASRFSDVFYLRDPRLLKFTGDEFLQLNHIGGESPDPLACFFVRHRVIVQHPAEFLFIQLQLLNVR